MTNQMTITFDDHTVRTDVIEPKPLFKRSNNSADDSLYCHTEGDDSTGVVLEKGHYLVFSINPPFKVDGQPDGKETFSLLAVDVKSLHEVNAIDKSGDSSTQPSWNFWVKTPGTLQGSKSDNTRAIVKGDEAPGETGHEWSLFLINQTGKDGETQHALEPYRLHFGAKGRFNTSNGDDDDTIPDEFTVSCDTKDEKGNWTASQSNCKLAKSIGFGQCFSTKGKDPNEFLGWYVVNSKDGSAVLYPTPYVTKV